MKSDKTRGIVYLICDYTRDRVYKIGVTRGSVENRIKRLQTGNSGELMAIKTWETDYPFYLEKHLHLKFGNDKIINEWFEIKDEDVSNFYEYCKQIEKNIEALKDNPYFKKDLK